MRPADLVLVCILTFFGVGFFVCRKYTRAVLDKKLKNAGRNQLKTMELLEEKGYGIIDCDRHVELFSVIDGKTYKDMLHVDFIVQKGHLRYLVKIASGGQSLRLGYRENREPLIGISALFHCPNILLVDPERKNIRMMRTFSKAPFPYRLKNLGKKSLIFCLGAFCAIIIMYCFF